MRSQKTHDLLRDARCVLHSSVSDINGSEGEFKLYGRAVQVDDRVREGDYEAGEMTIDHWSRERGVTTTRRTYP